MVVKIEEDNERRDEASDDSRFGRVAAVEFYMILSRRMPVELDAHGVQLGCREHVVPQVVQ